MPLTFAPSWWTKILVLAALSVSVSAQSIAADGDEWVIDVGRAGSVRHADPSIFERVEERRDVPAQNRREVGAAGSRHGVGQASDRRSSAASVRSAASASDRAHTGASARSSSSGTPRELLDPYGSVRASNINR